MRHAARQIPLQPAEGLILAPAAGRAYSAASSFASGKMILFTKKKMSMETPPFNTVVPMLYTAEET